jgi:hypothetical protein
MRKDTLEKAKADLASLDEAGKAKFKRLERNHLEPVKLKVGEGGSIELKNPKANIVDHYIQLLETIGVADDDVHHYVLTQLVAILGEDNMNAGLSLLRGIAPKDSIETMLASQMVSVNHLALVMMRRSLNENIPSGQVESLINRSTKLLKTFATLNESLVKYRNQGKQVIQVQHFNVENHGQAMIGNIGGGGVHAKT